MLTHLPQRIARCNFFRRSQLHASCTITQFNSLLLVTYETDTHKK